jgi:hypothetical protein
MIRSTVVPASLVLLVFLTTTPVYALPNTAEPGETTEFIQWDDCDGTPNDNGVFTETLSACEHPDKIAASAALTVGAFSTKVTSFATAFHDFRVGESDDNETVLNATVSVDINWEGNLFGGIGGEGAEGVVAIEVSLLDISGGNEMTMGQTEVFQKTHNGATITVKGSNSISFPATVVRSHRHSILVTITCIAQTGAFGVAAGCDFFPGALNSDKFVQWRNLSITIEQDINDRFDRIDENLAIIESKIDDINVKIDALEATSLEIIRLLHTPTGRRASDSPACDGEPCVFPNKGNRNE